MVISKYNNHFNLEFYKKLQSISTRHCIFSLMEHDSSKIDIRRNREWETEDEEVSEEVLYLYFCTLALKLMITWFWLQGNLLLIKLFCWSHFSNSCCKLHNKWQCPCGIGRLAKYLAHFGARTQQTFELWRMQITRAQPCPEY